MLTSLEFDLAKTFLFHWIQLIKTQNEIVIARK